MNKKRLEELLKLNKIQIENMNNLHTELTGIWSQMTDDIIDEDTKSMVALKYDKIDRSDLSTWENIKLLPFDVLVKWMLRLSVSADMRWGSGSVKLKTEIGEVSAKQVFSWLWDAEHCIKHILTDPSSADCKIEILKEKYSKCNSTSKKYIQVYFDELKEEILKYENR